MENFPLIWFDPVCKWPGYNMPRNYPDRDSWTLHYYGVLTWIWENIEGPLKHSRWKICDTSAIFLFRHERDLIKFMLRWGQ